LCLFVARLIPYKTLSLLEEKIGSLEKRLAASLNALEARSEHVKGHTAPALNAQEHCAAVRGWPAYAVYAIVAGFLAALASIMTFEIALEAKSVDLHYLFLAFLFLSTFCPFPFGVLTGMVGGRHTKAYIITGLGAGLISLAGHCVLLGHHAALVPGWHWLAVAILFPFGSTALFLAGGLLGDRLVDRMNRRVRIGLFGEDLERLRGLVAPNTTREERFELTKALGPAVLTLIGSLTNSALVFIAATHYLQ